MIEKDFGNEGQTQGDNTNAKNILLHRPMGIKLVLIKFHFLGFDIFLK